MNARGGCRSGDGEEGRVGNFGLFELELAERQIGTVGCEGRGTDGGQEVVSNDSVCDNGGRDKCMVCWMVCDGTDRVMGTDKIVACHELSPSPRGEAEGIILVDGWSRSKVMRKKANSLSVYKQ